MAGQVWEVDELGGYMYSDELSNVLRTALQPAIKFRQLCDAQDATDKGYGAGDLYHWNVYTKVQTRGGALDERTAMPETNYEIKQGSLTVDEYGTSIPYNAKLDNLSKQPVSDVIHKVLKDDAKVVIDGEAHAQFNLTPLTVAPDSGTSTTAVTLETTGTCTVTNNVALGKGHVKVISDLMKERNIPGYFGDDYGCIAWPSTYRPFKDELESIHTYVDAGFQMILNGEIGRYEGIRFLEQTNVPKGGAEDSTTWNYETADPWNNAKSDWAFFFGADTVAEAIVVPEEIRGKIPGDFGRSRGVAWYYLGGFGIVHGPNMDVTQARIIKWESAA